MAACQGPSAFSMKREKKDRQRGLGGVGRREQSSGEWQGVGDRDRDRQGQGSLLQITAILHKPSRKQHSFSLPDLMGYSGCRRCISCQDKWEITGEPVWGQVSGRPWPGARWHHSLRWQLSPWWRSCDPQSSGGLRSADRKGGDGGPSQALSHRLSGWQLSISLPYFFFFTFFNVVPVWAPKCNGKRS